MFYLLSPIRKAYMAAASIPYFTKIHKVPGQMPISILGDFFFLGGGGLKAFLLGFQLTKNATIQYE